jgi:hypothetical protein
MTTIFDSIEQDPKQEEIKRCAIYRKGALESIVSAYETSFNDFWNNNIVTPQEHCDYFGNKARDFFIVNSQILAFIQSLKPDYQGLPIPNEFVINEDGTVTITTHAITPEP